jgi:hypothetical protein
MAASEKSLHPALQFVRDNFLLIGFVAVVVVSLLVIVLKQGPGAEQTAAPVPSITATAGAPAPKATAGKPSSRPSAPSATPTSTDPAAVPEASEEPTAAASATEAPIVGTTNQSVELQNWRPYAEKFAAAYGNTSGGKSAWLARLRPLVTDDLYSGFKLTDISRVETLTFSGVNTMTEEDAYATFTANYTEKSGYIDGLAQVQGDGSWKIGKIAKHQN